MKNTYTNIMRYMSVCSGIEAATVAWESLGWQAVAENGEASWADDFAVGV